MDVDTRGRIEVPRRRGRYERFGFGDVWFAEKELAV
jgi:hypothetical protein